MKKRKILAFLVLGFLLAFLSPYSVYSLLQNGKKQTSIGEKKVSPGDTTSDSGKSNDKGKNETLNKGNSQAAVTDGANTHAVGSVSLDPETAATDNKSKKDATPEITEERGLDWIWIAKLVLSVIAAFLVIGGLAWLIYVLYQNKQRERSEIRAAFSDLKTKNNSLSQKIEALTKLTGELSQQIAQQRSDIQRLQQKAADGSGASYVPPPPVPSQPKEPPRFPIGVTDYLAKFGQNSTPVKFDYKEGILVSDPTNEGCLMIVNDGGSVYVVPSYGFFQTKSDYTNYFEKYYTCARPMGGNAWIVQPASVNQVAGGWQLASMGELEIR